MPGGKISGAPPAPRQVAAAQNGTASANKSADAGQFNGRKVALAPPGSYRPRQIAARASTNSYSPLPSRKSLPSSQYQRKALGARTQLPPTPSRSQKPQPAIYEEPVSSRPPRDPVYQNLAAPAVPDRHRGAIYQNPARPDGDDTYQLMNPAPSVQGQVQGQVGSSGSADYENAYEAMNPLPTGSEENIYSEPENIYESLEQVQRAGKQPLPADEFEMQDNPAYETVSEARGGKEPVYERIPGFMQKKDVRLQDSPTYREAHRKTGGQPSPSVPDEGVYEDIRVFQRGDDANPPLPPRNPAKKS